MVKRKYNEVTMHITPMYFKFLIRDSTGTKKTNHHWACKMFKFRKKRISLWIKVANLWEIRQLFPKSDWPGRSACIYKYRLKVLLPKNHLQQFLQRQETYIFKCIYKMIINYWLHNHMNGLPKIDRQYFLYYPVISYGEKYHIKHKNI